MIYVGTLHARVRAHTHMFAGARARVSVRVEIQERDLHVSDRYFDTALM